MLLDLLAKDMGRNPSMAAAWADRLKTMQDCVAAAKRMLTDQARLLQHVSPKLETTSLAELIARSVTSVLPPTGSLHIEDGTPPIEGIVDRALMGEVFQELATNAIRAAGPDVAITVTLTQANSSLPARDGEHPIARVEFFNRGPTASDEVLAKAFQPGFSGDKQKRGLGLGLAIIRRFVEAHEGSIATVPCKEGFRMVISLPRKETKYGQ